MERRKTIYLILILLSSSGVVLSYLFGPGTIVPGATLYTILCGLVLFFAEYMWLRENTIMKGKPITAKWTMNTLALLIVALIPEFLYLTVVAFLWVLFLPTIGVLIVVLLIKLFRNDVKPSRSKKK